VRNGIGGNLRRRLWPAGVQAKLRVASGAALALLVPLLGAEILGAFDGAMAPAESAASASIASDFNPRDGAIDAWLNAVGRRSLFKPAVPLPSRPMAREAVSRVRELLSVHGILDRDGQPVAYINIRGMGMRPYEVGEGVDEMFEVTRIENGKVEVEITGERLELEM